MTKEEVIKRIAILAQHELAALANYHTSRGQKLEAESLLQHVLRTEQEAIQKAAAEAKAAEVVAAEVATVPEETIN